MLNTNTSQYFNTQFHFSPNVFQFSTVTSTILRSQMSKNTKKTHNNKHFKANEKLEQLMIKFKSHNLITSAMQNILLNLENYEKDIQKTENSFINTKIIKAFRKNIQKQRLFHLKESSKNDNIVF